jgi:hypothetical protein
LQEPAEEIKTADKHTSELLQIITDIKSLLKQIDSDIPLLQLAITASGESLSNALPAGVSPSRLLQASTFLIIGDTQYASDPTRSVQIGPAFTLSMYMLFLGHDTVKQHATAQGESSSYGTVKLQGPYGFGDGDRRPLWQEVIHKARVRLCRTPLDHVFDPSQGYYQSQGIKSTGSGFKLASTLFGTHRWDEFAYHLEIIEDLDDGRVHDGSENCPSPYDNIARAGIRESIPIEQISKLFYTDTGRILNIGNSIDGSNNSIILLKRDVQVQHPMLSEQQEYFETDSIRPPSRDTGSLKSNEQSDIDRQLWHESEVGQQLSQSPATRRMDPAWLIPPHLDPEWIALEVFEEDDNLEDDDEYREDSDNGDGGGDQSNKNNTDTDSEIRGRINPPDSHITHARNRSSLDSRLITQIQNISIRSSPPTSSMSSPLQSRTHSQDAVPALGELTDGFVARSPFGAITSSLSLMEMLVRLTSLQVFQQTSHLSIPDHILTFFLDETSSTGLTGEEALRARNEAKRRVGFDPYSDTP